MHAAAPEATPGPPHAGVRIALLFAFAAALPQLPTWSYWLSGLIALVWLRTMGASHARFYLNGLWRLRWLFFAIVALHLWQGGGEVLWPGMPGLTELGVEQALRRSGLLVALLGVVVIVTRSTPPRWLAAGLVWGLQPLARIGVPTQRFATRVGLVFAAVDGTRDEAAQLRTGYRRLDEAAARLLLAAERGDYTPGQAEALPHAGALQMLDRGLLLLAAVVLFALYAP
ncbi:hypothetical protein [Algiphilus sp.]|uniref:hypothetical protein n=1 Tax=Algiphilus sp. TaxID=1872431 RepID=UPI003B520750